MNKKVKEKIVDPLKALLDLRFIIPALFLIVSLIGNGVQCGKNALRKHWLERTKNALDLALAQKKSMKAKVAIAEYRAIKKATDPKILKNNKEYQRLKKEAEKYKVELVAMKKKVGNLTISGVRKELNKEIGGNTTDLPPEPTCPPCPCRRD